MSSGAVTLPYIYILLLQLQRMWESQSAEHNRRAVLNAAFSPLSNFSESFRSQRLSVRQHRVGHRLSKSAKNLEIQYGNPFGLEILGDLPLEMTQNPLADDDPTKNGGHMSISHHFFGFVFVKNTRA